MKAEIWTKEVCPYCVEAKRILQTLSIPYSEYIISAGINEQSPAPNQFYVPREQLLAKMPTARTVPQIWIDDVYIGGCTDLQAAVASGQVKSNITL